MDIKFSKDSDPQHPQAAAPEKKSQSALVVLLLVLVGGFAYLYFFTDLIRPQIASQPAPVPVTAPQVVKMPLPDASAVPAAVAGKNNAVEKPAEPAQAAAPTTSPKTAVVAPTPAVKPAASRQEAKPAVPASAVVKTPLPTAPAAKQPVHPAAVAPKAAKKPANSVAVVKASPAKVAAVPGVAPAKPATAARKTTVQANDNGSWSIQVGSYALEETLAADMGRVRSLGLVPVVKAAERKKAQMNRLLLAEYKERAAATAAFERLKLHTSDAFMIDQRGIFAVYAGSYLLVERAGSEKARLTAEGFPVSIKHTAVAIPSQSLIVGPFNGKKAAAAAAAKLKRAGFKPFLVRR